MKLSVIICAAGKGERAGFENNKLLQNINGSPVLWHTISKFNMANEILVTYREEDYSAFLPICRYFGATLVKGGKTRTESVFNALKVASGNYVLVHDGARPFVTRQIIDGCIDSIRKHDSGVCAIPVTETTAIVVNGRATSIPERSSIYTIQTPQGFITNDLLTAYEKAINDGCTYTDDSSIYAKYFEAPYICEGSRNNIKLTYQSDFPQEEKKIVTAFDKVGFGIDTHVFGEGDFVTLCGVDIPCEMGLVAHSDGDVALHAVMDSLLSAAGLKDIGHYFPTSDDKWLNASSVEMLKEVVKIIRRQGFCPSYANVTIQAETPKLSSYIDAMKAKLATTLGINEKDVAISAGTCEGLGFVGEQMGIVAYATTAVVKTE